MKKILLFILPAFILIITSCEQKNEIPGMVGQQIPLAIPVISESDTAGCYFRWEFQDKPSNSGLNVLSFQPSSSSYNISFTPDVPGKYTVVGKIINDNGEIEKKEEFICNVVEDTLGQYSREERDTSNTEVSDSTDSSFIKPEYGDIKKETTQDKQRQKDSTEKMQESAGQTTSAQDSIEYAPPTVSGEKYTIQLSSWENRRKAQKMLKKLEDYNLDIYIQRKHFGETGETWYRVRTGVFADSKSAKAKARQLEDKLSKYNLGRFWVDKINQ